MPVTSGSWRMRGAIGLTAALVIGATVGAVTLSRRTTTSAPDSGTGSAAAGQPGAGVNAAGGSPVGPMKLAPGVVPGSQLAVEEPPPVETPDRLRAEIQVTQEMLSNLDATLADLKRLRRHDEVAMVEAKQAELRAKLSQSSQRLDRIATRPVAKN